MTFRPSLSLPFLGLALALVLGIQVLVVQMVSWNWAL